jgi:hypothetical protein
MRMKVSVSAVVWPVFVEATHTVPNFFARASSSLTQSTQHVFIWQLFKAAPPSEVYAQTEGDVAALQVPPVSNVLHTDAHQL